MIHCYVITADTLPLNNCICQSSSSYWFFYPPMRIWLRWQTFSFLRLRAFTRSLGNQSESILMLSNRKGAQYLKMLKGISVCLLDTFLIVIYWIWKYFIYLDSFCTALFENRYSRLLPYLLPRNFMVFDKRIMALEVIQVLNAVVRGFQFR